MNYYRRYVGDYLRDTARLSMIDHGAYNLLLDYYYADEQPLPLDHQELYTMVRAMRPEDRKAIDKVLGLFFTQEPDGYHQKRVDHEITVSRKARDNGKHGGRPPIGREPEHKPEVEPESKPIQLTGTGTETITGSGHPPTTNHQPPAASLQPPKEKQAQAPIKKLTDLGVDEQIAKDWLAVRKAKRAPLTDTALDELKLEAGKAGLSVADAVAICAKRSWQGFKASWDWQAVSTKSNGGGNGKFNPHAAGRKLYDQAVERDMAKAVLDHGLVSPPGDDLHGEVYEQLPGR